MKRNQIIYFSLSKSIYKWIKTSLNLRFFSLNIAFYSENVIYHGKFVVNVDFLIVPESVQELLLKVKLRDVQVCVIPDDVRKGPVQGLLLVLDSVFGT